MHNKSATGVWNMVDIKTGDTHVITPNTTCDVGRAQILARLVGTDTNVTSGIITYVSIGTDSTPATTSDVGLVAETHRTLIIPAYTVITGTTAKVYARFNQGFTATVSEVGLWLQGTSTLNSGVLLARSVLSAPITKISADAMTIERTISIVNHV